MLSQLLNQMDEYLSNRPFKRRWWSRSWKSYLKIHPPLSEEAPLWKRSLDELHSLRLFDLSPEELGRKIEHYWKKPRWRRWFSYFGMNKKIDVWNYYQRCLAYQAVRPDHLEQASVVMPSAYTSFFKELALCLYQVNAKFETYIEKRNPRWLETHYSEEINAYTQRLKETFLTKLRQSLKKMKIEGEEHGFILKQQAEQEYQQVEALMLRYYHQRLNYFFSQSLPGNLIPERVNEVIQDEEWVDLEDEVLEENLEPGRAYVMVVAPGSSQTASSSSPLPVPREVHPTEIHSLHGAKEWIKNQRQCLNSLIAEGSLQKVDALLQTSFNEIKTITDLYLEYCDAVLSDIEEKQEDYGIFLKYLNNLQCQLKPLLQGGMLLFHPDHMMSLTPSQAMWELIGRYSQCYIDQYRYYLGKFENYRLRIEDLSLLEQQKLQRQPFSSEWSDLGQHVQELSQSIEELKQSLKEFTKQLREIEAKRAQDKEAWEAKLKEDQAQRASDKEEAEAKLKEVQAQRARDKEESEAKLKEVQAQRASDKEEAEAQRVRDKEEAEAQRARDKEEAEAKLKGLEARFSQFFTPVTQPALDSRSTTASNQESSENSHNTDFFKF
ncbi:hypothetical protein [Rickettsiella massiliensis]|uniref:hypothetical protein n=1 Tax=Rickettsiella massiliensis TaxID=676517 RepID=UPI00029AD583|nr:hypothetical protein [Rickettsiella massiliensis]